MPFIRQSIPSLLNGISQQPPSVRQLSQAEEQINAFSSLSEGLKKRAAFEHVAKLTGDNVGDAYVHTIHRDAVERYTVVVEDNSVRVWDLSGNAQTVNYAERTFKTLDDQGSTGDGIARQVYIPDAESTITLKTTGISGDTVVWEKADDEGFTTGVATLRTDTTDTDATVAWTPGTDNGKWVRARVSVYSSGTIDGDITWKDTSYLNTGSQSPRSTFSGLTVADFTFLVNNTVTVALDGIANTESITDTHQTFSDLPASPTPGNIYKVAGDPSNAFEPYYVKFDGDVYNEYKKPGEIDNFDTATMPHTLVRNSSGGFDFGAANWLGRPVGDTTTAPDPVIVGQKCEDVFFYRNRLGLLAGENALLSRDGSQANGYFNFWPESITAILATDPISLRSPHEKVSNLKYAVAFEENVLCFSPQAQFSITGADTFTPTTAKITPTTEFEASEICHAVGVGTDVYFATDKDSHTTIREYFVDPDVESNDAADITAHTPKLLPGNVFKLIGTSAEDVVMALSSDAGNRIYVYKFFWDGDNKAQSSWSYWELDSDDSIINIDMIGSVLYATIQRTDGVHLEKMNVNIDSDPSVDDLGIIVHLDSRVKLTGVYDAGNDWTTWTLPYDFSGTVQLVLDGGHSNREGERIDNITRPSSTTVRVAGEDLSGSDVYIGKPYTMSYTFSEQFPRTGKGEQDGQDRPILAGRLQMRDMSLRYRNSGYFQVTVTPQARPARTYTFTGKILGESVNKIGDIVITSGTWKFRVGAHSKRVTITITNSTYLPSTFFSAEWTGVYSPTGRD